MDDPSPRVAFVRTAAIANDHVLPALRSWNLQLSEHVTALGAAAALIGDRSTAPKVALIDERLMDLPAEWIARQFRADPDLGEVRLVLLAAPQSDEERTDTDLFDAIVRAPIAKTALYAAVFASGSTQRAAERGNVLSLRRPNTAATAWSILVVDHDRARSHTLTRGIEADGHRVFQVDSVDAAVEVVLEHGFDAVVLAEALESRLLRLLVQRRYSRRADALRSLFFVLRDAAPNPPRAGVAEQVDGELRSPYRPATLLAAIAAGVERRARDAWAVQGRAAIEQGDRIIADIDPNRLRELAALGSDSNFLNDLFDSFLAEADDLLADLRAAPVAREADRTRDLIESLGATAASVGCMRVWDTCLRAHSAVGTEAFADALLQIELAYTLARGAIRQLARHPATGA